MGKHSKRKREQDPAPEPHISETGTKPSGFWKRMATFPLYSARGLTPAVVIAHLKFRATQHMDTSRSRIICNLSAAEVPDLKQVEAMKLVSTRRLMPLKGNDRRRERLYNRSRRSVKFYQKPPFLDDVMRPEEIEAARAELDGVSLYSERADAFLKRMDERVTLHDLVTVFGQYGKPLGHDDAELDRSYKGSDSEDAEYDINESSEFEYNHPQRLWLLYANVTDKSLVTLLNHLTYDDRILLIRHLLTKDDIESVISAPEQPIEVAESE